MNKSGIYRIRNITNDKFYIGSTFSLKGRESTHFSNLSLNQHKNKILQNSYNKYGKDNFIFEIIEECEKDKLIEREQHYLDLFNPAFNIRKIANSNVGITVNRTKESRDAWIAKKKNLSEKTLERMRQYKHMLGKKASNETKAKMSFKAKKAIIQYDMEMNFIKDWSCAKEAAEVLKIHRTLISSCCCGNKFHAGKFIWKFKN